MPPLPPQAPEKSEVELLAEQAHLAEKSSPPLPPPVAKKLSHRDIPFVALGPGFYANERMVEGSEGVASTIESMGDWMKCKNPEHQKALDIHLAKKKDALRLKAGK